MSLYFISDRAYDILTQYGQRQGYIKLPTNTKEAANRANGMSAFLEALPYTSFEDTRPQLVRQRHQEEIKHNRAPSWTGYYSRRQRQITLTEQAMEKYIMIAISLNIITPEPYAVGGPSRLTFIPTISLVLEAIGLKWLTPVSFPLKGNSRFPSDKKRR